MSWIQKLYETYDNCEASIGVEAEKNSIPLLPICHTTQKAQIEIVIDGEGNFKRANVISKDDARTIIPCTEKSSGRTSGEAPHPLCDKLQYIAMDYPLYCGRKKTYFPSYSTQLEKWCASEYSSPKAISVMRYIKKGSVIKDLIDHQVLHSGEDKKLLEKWDKKKEKNIPKFFQVSNLQGDAFIRWRVETQGDNETKVWRDKELWDSWIHYYLSTKQQKSLCFVTGENKFIPEQHPAKIQNDADKAKLISSNDWSTFTFRGRFTDTKKNNTFQTYSVGFDVSQKAHSALRWLIGRQGYRRDGLAIVAWAVSGTRIPQPTDDAISIFDMEGLVNDEALQVDTYQDLAIKLRNKIAGYSQQIETSEEIVVIGLDSATPGKGRMAITYYRELKSSDFLERLNNWHETCSWRHNYRFVDKKPIPFVGAPAPRDIAEAAYGKRVTDKLRKKTVERLLPCIIDGQPIPHDLVESAVRRASNRNGIKDPKDKYENEWNKTLSIACSLYKKYQEGKENYDMALDETRNTRDYLYGRLLAIADKLEETALYKADKKRATTATRYMQQFSQHPYRTWNQIHSALIPYMVQLNGAFFYKNQIAEVKSLFHPEEFINDKPLSGEYLLGYYSQRQKLFERKEDVSSDEN